MALANRTLARAETLAAEFGIDCTGSDYERLLDEVRPDFVDICTAVETHRAIAAAAAARGVAILCQKPLAPRIEESEALVADATCHGVRIMANDNWRWQGWYRELRHLIEGGAIGTP